MKVADGPDVYGYTIFCDDIRIEVGGKVTYVGAYVGGSITLHGAFPFTLSKFAMDVFYLQRVAHFVMPKRIIVVMPGGTEENPSMVLEIPATAAEQVAQFQEKEKSTESQKRFMRMGSPIIFSNLVISEPGEIKVRAERNGEFVRLGALTVMQDTAFAQQGAETKEAAN